MEEEQIEKNLSQFCDFPFNWGKEIHGIAI